MHPKPSCRKNTLNERNGLRLNPARVHDLRSLFLLAILLLAALPCPVHAL